MKSVRLMSCRGFTMMELVAVVIVLGVIGGFMASKYIFPVQDAATEAETLRVNLRFVQSKAMSDTVTWGMSFASGSYTLLKNGVASTAVNLPSETSSSNTRTITKTSITTGAGQTVHFNYRGIPTSDSAGATPMTADMTITFGGLKSVTITRNTGFIP